MVLPRRDSELGATLLTVVALAPLGLRAEKVEEPEEQLLRGDLQVEDGHAGVVDRAEDRAGLDQGAAERAVALRVGYQQGCVGEGDKKCC